MNWGQKNEDKDVRRLELITDLQEVEENTLIYGSFELGVSIDLC